MAGSAPLGYGRPASGTASDGPNRTRTLPRLAGALLPGGISGNGRPPRPASTISAPKKRRLTFVAPTRPAVPRSIGVLPRQGTYLDAGVDPGGVRPPQVPDAALAPSSFLHRQLFEAPPPSPLLPAPSHEAHQRGSVFTSAGRKSSTPSFSEPARLPSHQAKNTSMEVAASTMSMQDDGGYFSSSSTPIFDWNSTPTANNTVHELQVSPHEFLQAVMKAINKRFQIGVQSDPVEFMSWLLNTQAVMSWPSTSEFLHAKLKSSKKKNRSIIHDCFQVDVYNLMWMFSFDVYNLFCKASTVGVSGSEN